MISAMRNKLTICRLSAAMKRSKPRSLGMCSTAAAAPNPAVINTRPLSNWMFSLAGMVAGMVTVGGITRLTRSGLSMTDWKLQGSLPPITEAEWDKEFARWKTFPEAQQRKDLTLNDFKFIYFWEYGHRMLGRVVGLVFAVPFTYFAARRMIPRALYPRLAVLFSMGGAQGLVGWWMVKSGLDMDPEQQKEIRVSPYRLASHLTMAFATYSLLVWTGLELRIKKNMYNITGAVAGRHTSSGSSSGSGAMLRTTMADVSMKFNKMQLSRALGVRRAAVVATAVVATTAFSGAFVAGNDAGRAYNTFPKMGDTWVPEGILELQPLWRNVFENTACVQFDHRVLAMSSLASIGAVFLAAYPRSAGSTTLRRSAPPVVGANLKNVGRMALLQVSLGVSTLLLYVPTELAVAHQVGALGLLTLVIRLVHSLNYAKEQGGLETIAAASNGGGGSSSSSSSSSSEGRSQSTNTTSAASSGCTSTRPLSTLCTATVFVPKQENSMLHGNMRLFHTSVARSSFEKYAAAQQQPPQMLLR